MQTMTNRTSSTSVKPRPSSGRMSSGSAKGSGFGAGAGGGDGYDYGRTYAAFVDCYVERFLEESLQTALQSRGECILPPRDYVCGVLEGCLTKPVGCTRQIQVTHGATTRCCSELSMHNHAYVL